MITFFNDLKYIFTNPALLHNDNKIELKTYFIYFIYIQAVFLLLNSINALLFYHFNMTFSYNMNALPFFYVVLFAPLMEELTFRSYLKKSRLNIALFFGGLVYFILTFFSKNKVIAGFISFSAILIFYFILVNCINKLYFLNPYNKKQLLFLIYLSSISFGISHLANYNLSEGIFFLFLIVSIPKILGGFVFAMYRIKFGFIPSLLLHSFSNLIGYFILKFLS